MADVPLQVISENSSSERRITPSWTISQLRTKLEPITGIPPSSQKISLKTASGSLPIEASDEDNAQLTGFPLAPYAELHVADTRPAGARPNFTDTSGVEKYVMPEEEYAKKSDSVLAWKKAQKLGRFDPDAPSHEQAKIAALQQEIEQKGIQVGKRCRVGGEDSRRGTVKYVGDVKEIPGSLGPWIGVHLDEPVGKNDGSIAGTRYWGEESPLKHGVFVRPERVEVGDWPVLDDLEDMEEI
ncbi:CAP-Gly domain-containing protein [Colletotrichum higginsianum]|uniref:CAP-Gly domain-containing protein n=3 Tax=Colletotrichum destructivum species complex TaxID=2707350 RepID=H1V4F6_COLHI|nr:CAP-Gly domain-containing protein [Colletotrichum higginsianum IMI 349063]OBR03614.1 CAP-Gly domain-containing protein [Colletotrichum higginsianum IMI 349063]TIC97454.1 Cell polarity protein alp11 [Colletotrichum higginsianum]GJD02039.1 CAP-Gly domain-containing protein [Colletotrichum higginsianum]CCF35108.1 CAP-Gly domain-containing protein [Colletotrichum higginsianum]